MPDSNNQHGDSAEAEVAARVEQEIRTLLSQKAPHQKMVVEALKPGDVIWGNVDSLLVLALVGHLEKAFGFKAKPKDFTPENLATIERIVAFVTRAQARK